MRIGIDIDGVLTDEHQYIIDNGTKFFSENNILYIVNKKIYDSEKIFEVSKSDYDNFWKEHIFEYSKNISPRPFSSKIINKLKEENNKIYIITARSLTTYENQYKAKMQSIVKDWLANNDIKYDDIIFCENKADVCKMMNIDVMIEDKPENIQNISRVTKVICYDHPYNENIKNDNIIRCYSWYDIYNEINNLN